MLRKRVFLFAVLSIVAVGDAVAQAPRQGPSPPGPAAQAIGPSQAPVPQPIYIVPAPQTVAPPSVRGVASELPLEELAPVLRRVERASNKRFVVDGAIGPRIFLGGVDANDVDYPVLLSILRANGLAAVEIDGRVNIVRDTEVRSLPAPMVQDDNSSIAADEWVTRVLRTTNISAAQLVPILRPLMPQGAHLAAHSDGNQLIVMDRYANVQRITAIVRALDVASPRREP